MKNNGVCCYNKSNRRSMEQARRGLRSLEGLRVETVILV
ncbi:hypothetical protein MSL71_45540 [Desulfoluna butyratoxydans]|uniref:Uncharacterized protein n=1 Tax=Desulfoluna butyratoxydans TaxID=231438 RepID=A0A4U8YXS2_9BACT|nr:hypothetical protein MSL71_45540 [Desulfoluna butyratoxydans]